MDRIIEECAANFGAAPRRFPLLFWLAYLEMTVLNGRLCGSGDKLNTHFRSIPRLFRQGRVVWGYVVQANGALFERGSFNAPGEIVYSLEDADLVEPETLWQVASDLAQLKGTNPAEDDTGYIANYLTNELIRVFGHKVPRRISPSLRCRISTTYFVRKDLPDRRITSGLIPIIASTRKPFTVMPLPVRYWSEELLDAVST